MSNLWRKLNLKEQREILVLAVGFEGVRRVAIDDDWSAIRFRRVEFIKKITRDPKRAMTKGNQRLRHACS